MGDELLDLREGEPGEARWRIPAGYADLSGKSYLGYAHGAAGIADTLLDLFDVTSEQRFADAALDAISWIARQAVQTLDDDSGLGWPQVESGRLHPPFGVTAPRESGGSSCTLLARAAQSRRDRGGAGQP